MSTPIVKVKKGRDERSFYNLTEYEEWRAEFGQEMAGASSTTRVGHLLPLKPRTSNI
jgi:hypothetical protein